MAIVNLASKYSGALDEHFFKNSYTAGNASTEYDFSGVRSISILSPVTVDLNNYSRTGLNRFGTPVEMGDTVQELTMSQDKSFSLTIDRGNYTDQMKTKVAARMLKMQLREQVIPYIDKYTFGRWGYNAGTITGLANAPTKTTIMESIFDGAKALDNLLVPDSNRILYIPVTYYSRLRLATELLAVDNLAEKSLTKGLVGMIGDMRVIKVPDTYLENMYFMITYKGSVIAPNKIKTARVLDEVAGVDGWVLEGRNYFDAFVLSAKAGGVYVATASSKVVSLPVITISSGQASIQAVTGVTFKYTVDGSDPRYSKSAATYASAVTVSTGTVFKAFGEKSGCFPSRVATATA